MVELQNIKTESSNSDIVVEDSSQVKKNESLSSDASNNSFNTETVPSNSDTTLTHSMKDWIEKLKKEKSSLEAQYKQSKEIFENCKACKTTTITTTTTTTTTATMKTNTSTTTSTTPSLTVQKRLDYCAKITAIAIAKEVSKSNTKNGNIVEIMQKDINSIIELLEEIICVSLNENSNNEIIKKYPELISSIRKETEIFLKHLNELLERQLHEPLKVCSDVSDLDPTGVLSLSTTREKVSDVSDLDPTGVLSLSTTLEKVSDVSDLDPTGVLSLSTLEEIKIWPSSSFGANNSKKEAFVKNGVNGSEESVELLIDLD